MRTTTTLAKDRPPRATTGIAAGPAPCGEIAPPERAGPRPRRHGGVGRGIAWAAAVALAFASATSRAASAEDDLVSAARTGRLEDVKALLETGRAPDPRSPGYSALMWAAERGDVAMTRLLLGKGADPAWHDHNGEFALQWAAKAGQVESARALLDAGAQADELDRYRRSALFAAAGAGHVGVVELLLARGADARRADERGEAVLFPACTYARTEVVRRLLSAGADPRAVRPFRKATPLHVAAERGDRALIDALVAAGGAVDARDEQEEAPLHAAARTGNAAAAAALLAHGADPDGGARARTTPFVLAVGGVGDTVAPLLVDVTRATGPALVAAAAAGRDPLVARLVARVGVPLPAAVGAEALEAGSAFGDVALVTRLLDAQAPLSTAGGAALRAAARAGRDGVVALLLARGVAVDARDGEGATALLEAAASGRTDVVERLLAAGADAKAVDAAGRGALARLDARIEKVAAHVASGDRYRGIPSWLAPAREELARLRAARVALGKRLGG